VPAEETSQRVPLVAAREGVRAAKTGLGMKAASSKRRRWAE